VALERWGAQQVAKSSYYTFQVYAEQPGHGLLLLLLQLGHKKLVADAVNWPAA